ncbi:MAG: hypothetical protein AcusKO_04710 [Acuticoccus sp.]
MSVIAPPLPTALARRQREQRRAVRHTRRVKRLRVALPVASAVIAVGLLGAAILPKLFPIAALAGLSLTADGLVMNEPRLAGHLGEGRRYEVVADRAVQSLLNPSRLSLEGLSADFDMGEGQRVTMAGHHAAYDTDTEILLVDGGLTINSTDGSTVSLKGARVDLAKRRVDSDGAIEIASPRGDIRAGALTVLDGGELMRMTDGVSITIHPASAAP